MLYHLHISEGLGFLRPIAGRGWSHRSGGWQCGVPMTGTTPKAPEGNESDLAAPLKEQHLTSDFDVGTDQNHWSGSNVAPWKFLMVDLTSAKQSLHKWRGY